MYEILYLIDVLDCYKVTQKWTTFFFSSSCFEVRDVGDVPLCATSRALLFPQGEILIAQNATLDREIASEYQLLVKATDNGGDSGESGDTRSTALPVSTEGEGVGREWLRDGAGRTIG